MHNKSHSLIHHEAQEEMSSKCAASAISATLDVIISQTLASVIGDPGEISNSRGENL